MPIVLIIVGGLFLTAAVRWNEGGSNIWKLLGNDLTSSNKGNFFAWAVAIILIGAVGYIDELKPVANTMIGLIIVVLLLSNNGFFANLEKEVLAKPAQLAGSATAAIGGVASSIPGVLGDATSLAGVLS
jgi:hypothetical protein